MVPSLLRSRCSLDSKGNSALIVNRRCCVVVALLLGMLSLAAPGLLAQYSTTTFIDPNTFPGDVTADVFDQPIATDGTYTAIVSTDGSVWSKTVAGGTPLKLF